ncbi:MAG: hypothetical protein N3A66_11145 [Planctomycetota bacterium]|nr:hypothetical protein [Planctomycetota bacterium]
MPEDNRLYSTPSFPAIVAYLSAAVVIFFAGYNLYLERELANLRRDVQRLREEMAQAQTAAALAAAENITAAVPALAPPPRAEAARPPAVEKVPSAPSRLEAPPPAPPRLPVEARAPERAPENTAAAPASGDIALARAPGPDTEAMLRPAEQPIAAPPAARPAGERSSPSPAAAPAPPRPAATENSPAAEVASGAQVLATNPEQMRVIIGVGVNQGIAPGRRFHAYRGSAWVGDVRVVKTFADMSMCEIITPTSRGMRVGDIAKAAAEKEEGAEAR